MKNRKCIKPHLTHGKNKSIKRIFLILYLFAKIPKEKNRKKRRENRVLGLTGPKN